MSGSRLEHVSTQILAKVCLLCLIVVHGMADVSGYTGWDGSALTFIVELWLWALFICGSRLVLQHEFLLWLLR